MEVHLLGVDRSSQVGHISLVKLVVNVAMAYLLCTKYQVTCSTIRRVRLLASENDLNTILNLMMFQELSSQDSLLHWRIMRSKTPIQFKDLDVYFNYNFWEAFPQVV